jgi:hypothetical protein
MIRIKTPSLRNSQLFFTALLIFILLSSCGTLSHIDKAQDEFNKGAELENATFYDLTNSSAYPTLPADYYYKVAYYEIGQALNNQSKLKKLNIYVHAMMLKTLCEWKLDNYENADNSARTAINYMKSNNISADDQPRDFAVLHAMSALIGIEEMNQRQEKFFEADSISSKAGIAEYNSLIHKGKLDRNIEKNLEDLETISSQLSQKHEMQAYLIQCQLAAMKVWSDALDALKGKMKDNRDFPGSNKTWYNSEKETMNLEISKYMIALKEKDKEDQGIYLFWQKIFPNT